MNPVLHDAAFGSSPGTRVLPRPSDAVEVWHRAVILGGQGCYAAAHTELDRARRRCRAGSLASLLCSTRGSLLRQLGWHAVAARADGLALRLVSEVSLRDRDAAAEQMRLSAHADALIGLAADAVGMQRNALAARLLQRAAEPAAGYWRSQVRLHWVRAEFAMATGTPNDAVDHAEAAVALARSAGSVRHVVKSTLVCAAAATCAGNGDGARVLLVEVRADARRHGMIPLQWAAAMLAAALEPQSDAAAVAARYADIIAIRGGRWAESLPVPRHHQKGSPAGAGGRLSG